MIGVFDPGSPARIFNNCSSFKALLLLERFLTKISECLSRRLSAVSDIANTLQAGQWKTLYLFPSLNLKSAII
jgi:hypothetical protein